MATNTGKKNNILFDIINALFTNRDYIYNLTAETAKQSLFMVLRRLAIKYPCEANTFNKSKVDALGTLKYLADTYYETGRVPKWMYTNGSAKSTKTVKDIQPSEIKQYKNHYNISEKEFQELMRFFPTETINEIKEITNLYKKLNDNK